MRLAAFKPLKPNVIPHCLPSGPEGRWHTLPEDFTDVWWQQKSIEERMICSHLQWECDLLVLLISDKLDPTWSILIYVLSLFVLWFTAMSHLFCLKLSFLWLLTVCLFFLSLFNHKAPFHLQLVLSIPRPCPGTTAQSGANFIWAQAWVESLRNLAILM